MELEWSETALRVLEQRYLLRDENGNIVETPEQLMHRVAHGLAQIETVWGATSEQISSVEQDFFDILWKRDFLPNTPTLFHAGLPKDPKYRGRRFMSACIVLPIEDSIDGIFKTLWDAAKIMQAGGGVGYAFSRLRPKGSLVKSSGGKSSGPVSFMHIYDVMVDVVAQGGKRRGAQMGVLNVHHPDILEFIDAKKENTSGQGPLHNFNISVAVTEEFIQAYKEDTTFKLVAPHTGEVVGELNAREVMHKIAENAWRTGDPGIIFIDRINQLDYLDDGRIEATNPCGEQPLPPYGSCNLGSINLKHMLKKTDSGYQWDWEKFQRTIRLAVRFLDNVIEANDYPIPELEDYAKKARRIGLGVMGWADALSLLGIPYDSEEALEEARKVGAFLKEKSHLASQELAQERGVFEFYDQSKWKELGIPMRNAAVTTIAPTGTLSILANVNSGIEPYFALAFERKITAGTFHEVQPTLMDVLKERELYSEELVQRIIENEGKLRDLEDLPEDIRNAFPTAMEVAPEWHVRMQAAWQENIDSSISKTVNLPYQSTVEDIENIYLMAYELGTKSITVYRDKSLELQVLNVPSTSPKERSSEETQEPRPKRIFPKRPEVLTGFTKKFRTGTGTLYVTVNVDENGRPIEVFTNASGSVAPAEIEAVARLVSIALQYGIPLDEIVDQLVQPVDPVSYKLSPEGLRSTAHGIALALKEAVSKGLNILGNGLKSATSFSLTLEETNASKKTTAPPKLDKEQIDTMKAVYGDERVQELLNSMGVTLCPVCGTPMVSAEGCLMCPNCGYSKCG